MAPTKLKGAKGYAWADEDDLYPVKKLRARPLVSCSPAKGKEGVALNFTLPAADGLKFEIILPLSAIYALLDVVPFLDAEDLDIILPTAEDPLGTCCPFCEDLV